MDLNRGLRAGVDVQGDVVNKAGLIDLVGLYDSSNTEESLHTRNW